ncbi:MAG TPA: DNA repair protein RadA [Patescibacteria group bacterium]|nr:DNA repair protein RadA [Patescibacteria group bacterium]
MAKAKIAYVCSSCGAAHSSWAGRCNSCGAWNTITEQIDIRSSTKSDLALSSGKILQTVTLDAKTPKPSGRLSMGITDIDEVLGGGVVPGSVVLIAGQPGIGKSTLLLQLAHQTAAKVKVLYISGEESPEQVSLRGQRLHTLHQNLKLAASTSANDIAATIATGDYDLVIIDSIQTIATEEIAGVPGSVSQVTNSTQLLTIAAKKTKTALFLVGHVTKDGAIAGPKVLEHAVDVVLQLEGDRYGGFRILRCIKNRFGSTNEAAILEMIDSGLKIVDNPSAAFLAERQLSDGSIVLATLEGTRPVLVEVQALVNTTSYGYPKRAAAGVDLNRVNLLVAMLERRTKLRLADKDIYINIIGGVKITEPAADLAICMAIASAAKGMQLKEDAVVFGEVGLSGEIRHVPWIDKRLSEAKKLGFKAAIGPRVSAGNKPPAWLNQMRDVRTALNTFLGKE